MSDKVLYPDNTTGRILDLCVLIYNFLDGRKDEGFETSSRKQSLNSALKFFLNDGFVYYRRLQMCFEL